VSARTVTTSAPRGGIVPKRETEKPVSVWLARPVADALEKAATAHGVSKSQWVRRSLQSSLIGGRK
jgi:hypothetical protein